MLRVKFNDENAMHSVSFKRILKSKVRLTGNKIPGNNSGFKVYRLSGEFLGDYSEYTKISEKLVDGFVFEKGT